MSDDEATPTEAPPDRLSVDATALKALAHPLRVRMYDLLGDNGPATASQLAEQVGESSGTTSYHLRQLAKHGFIEEDPDRGNKRDRYWRVRGYDLHASDMLDDPEAVHDFRVVSQELWRSYARQIENWFRTADRWGPEWMDSSVSSMARFAATQEEMRELREDVLALAYERIERWQDREPPEGSTRVVMQFHLFPLGEPQDDDRTTTP
jgi:DNA-binding transcriptional ArsR family regulator